MNPTPLVLVHFRAEQRLATSLDSIRKSTLPLALSVVNNGGSPEVPDGVTLIEAPSNLGYTGGANLGLSPWLASGEPFCFLGSHDVEVAPDSLERLLAFMQRRPEFGILGPNLMHPQRRSAVEVEERDWVSGTLLLLRRECLLDIGLFDPRFGSYVEDVNLCHRARRQGWKVGILPDVPAHQQGSSSPLARHLMLRNGILLDHKEYGLRGAAGGIARVLWPIALHAMALFHPSRARRMRQPGNIRVRLGAVRDALRHLL